MRTDISVPRAISEAAEQMAQRLGISLSELYTAALTAYVATHQKNEVTRLLNQVYEVEPSDIEPVLVNLQVASLDGEAW
jgi:cell division ATPase FtsA